MKSLPQNPTKSFRERNPHLYAGAGGFTKACIEACVGNPCDPKPPKRIRQDAKPLMNKLESEFQRDYEANTHHSLLPQSIRFKLGNGIWYKPDFMLFIPAGVFAFEVKGPYSFRGGFENLKVAASKYLSITWRLVWKENGEWKEQTVLP